MTNHYRFDQLPFEDYLNFDELELWPGEAELNRYRRPLRGGRPVAMRVRAGVQQPARPHRQAAHSAICSCARCRRPIFAPRQFAFPIEPLTWTATPAVSDSGPLASDVFGSASPPGLADASDGAADTSDDADVAADSADTGQEELFGNLWDTIQRGVNRAAGAVGSAFSKPQIIDLTAQAERTNRKGTRAESTVDALVLHQMACCFNRRNPLRNYLQTKSHFVILKDGRILQLHPISALLWASNGFNSHSVAVEFAGNFPNTRGHCWEAQTPGCNMLTHAQLESGRYLVVNLKRTINLKRILAHCQSNGDKTNDPGPDIWYHVGQWAIDHLGLSDGGPGYAIPNQARRRNGSPGLPGIPIPNEWRTWGARGATPELEVEPEFLNPNSPAHTRWLQRSLNQALGLRLPEDGTLNPAVRSAMRSFQRQQGMPEDGELSDELEAELVRMGAQAHRHGEDEGEAFIGDLWDTVTGAAGQLASGLGRLGSAGSTLAGTALASGGGSGLAALGGARQPPKFRQVVRHGQPRGLARYGGGRVDLTLRAMRGRGLITITDEDIDTFQRIANVETNGLIQGLNTWDSAVVSIGFMQWTLQFGELQYWINHAAAAFQRYGIAVDHGRSYRWNSGNSQPAIVGANTKDELRWNGWAERFYQAGLDEQIITAEVELAVLKLQQHLSRLQKRIPAADYTLFRGHYDRSLPIRGLFQEAFNNLPLAAIGGVQRAITAARRQGGADTSRFLGLLQQGIREAYRARNDNGENVISKTLQGARF